MKKFYIGLDVGGTTIKYGIFDENKKLVEKFFIETLPHKKNAEKYILDRMADRIDEYLLNNRFGYKKENLAGIGFAMPGPVSNNITFRVVNIYWTKVVDIPKYMNERFGAKVKITVINDANAAALGEYYVNLKDKYKDICYFILGTGVGSGIIIDGKIIEGKNGLGGELGHLRVDYGEDAIKCNCGNVGCLETVASGTGISNVYYRLYETKRAAKDIIADAKTGDKKALKTLDISLTYLARMIINVMQTYEPEAIVLGGGVSNGGKILVDMLNERVKNQIYMTKKIPKIIIAKLKNDAGIFGTIAVM